MKANDLKLPGAMGGNLLGAIFQGEFDQILMGPGSWELSALVGGYITVFSSQCRAQIADPVELSSAARWSLSFMKGDPGACSFRTRTTNVGRQSERP